MSIKKYNNSRTKCSDRLVVARAGNLVLVRQPESLLSGEQGGWQQGQPGGDNEREA
ncbi:hypothetical protein [Massilia horti]|uniref:hypothetical protein n=1 Tax=Massilia horti TaxID=2562153 RepID=UPI001430B455|nr:hypothetical protein [Massilia horti]